MLTTLTSKWPTKYWFASTVNTPYQLS